MARHSVYWSFNIVSYKRYFFLFCPYFFNIIYVFSIIIISSSSISTIFLIYTEIIYWLLTKNSDVTQYSLIDWRNSTTVLLFTSYMAFHLKILVEWKTAHLNFFRRGVFPLCKWWKPPKMAQLFTLKFLLYSILALLIQK